MPNKHYDFYSVDAGIMIRLKDMLPVDLFKPAWDEISRLVSDGRWKIFENVMGEVRGQVAKKWSTENSLAVVKFNPTINDYMNKLMADLQSKKMTIVEPMSLKNDADPFVIMLALYLEQRDLLDLRKRTCSKTCCVLTREESKKDKVNIPYVCEYYDIPYMNLFQFMKHHGWHISLDVNNPD